MKIINLFVEYRIECLLKNESPKPIFLPCFLSPLVRTEFMETVGKGVNTQKTFEFDEILGVPVVWYKL